MGKAVTGDKDGNRGIRAKGNAHKRRGHCHVGRLSAKH